MRRKPRLTQSIAIVFIGSISLLFVFSVWMLTPIFHSRRDSRSMATLASHTEVALQIDKNIPKSLYPCLPKQVQKLQLKARATANQSSYYIIGIYRSQPATQEIELQPTYQETLIELDNAGCLLLIPKEKMGMASMIQYVPEQVARELQFQRYRRTIAESGGQQKFQTLLLQEQNHSPGDVPYYFPEDVWALEQLGIKLPNNIKVIQHIDEL